MIIAGTGHRPDKLGGYGQMLGLADFADEQIKLIKPSLIISGMALGWDQALAYAAIQNSIPFIAYVPFAGQENAWPQESKDRYHRFLRRASEVKIICEGGYAPWKMQVRNQAMVDDCDSVLALWNGSAGGTGNCIKYANKVSKEIINLWPEYQKIIQY